MSAARSAQDPQTVDSSRADAEWKADGGAGDIAHGVGDTVSSLTPIFAQTHVRAHEHSRRPARCTQFSLFKC